jgi:Ca2+-binding RTX toxin-like protein
MKTTTRFLTVLTLSVTLGFAATALAAVINGTDGDDDLDGTAQADVMNGKAGNDNLNGMEGDDHLNGGPGDDFLVGGLAGDDVLNGGDGNDLLRGITGSDVARGGAGDDQIDLHEGFDPLQFFAPCRAQAPDSLDLASGGDGDDLFTWASGAVTHPLGFSLCLVSGDAQVDGGDGYDTIQVGVAAFLASSSDYVIEAATVPGHDAQLRSVLTGATLNFKGVEEIRFGDTTLYEPF